jgi:Cu(I)/Ag(I) efflux system membrane fusion protein
MYLVALGSADPRLTEGWHIFECPMTRGFGKWFQKSNELANPYMGQKMLKCGNATTWSVPALERAQAPAADNGEIAYYTCPMHPSVRQQTPGQCPICSMDLTPVTRTEVESGTILVDAERRQRIGVRTEVVKARELSTTVRTVGEVTYDESRLFDVNLRVSGWVQDLRVTNTGSPVKKGQRLFTLYSPELYASQREFLSVAGTSAPQSVGKLAEVSRTRLHLLGMTDAQIRELARRGTAQENVPILSPASGYVIEKNVVEGAQVEAGTQAYRIADLSKIWIDANVYESDLRHVKPKQAVSIELPFVPGRTYEGEVDYVYPKLEGATRTGQVRIVVKNPDLELKPNMYADVVFEVDLGERLAIPESAVIYTGPRRLVFVDLGEGRLRPQVVKLGIHADGWFEVVEGLNAGDTIVTSANFLIAAESRLRSAAQYWQGGANDDAR